ncbi:interferon gamma receptor 2 [Cololabis saira]|uniref:interferon gamma receptor 2 n=1 Tax=Cololabis saira TaxID=129043 RepID=UPI002AD210CE|nr:interferon gamma receptor 2 [Cololabis saira]
MDLRIVFLSGLFLCHAASSPAPSAEMLPEPSNVFIDQWNLTWAPAPGLEDKTITHVVEYRSFNSHTWRVLPECANVSRNFCDFSPTSRKSDDRCIMLRVRAEQQGRRSVPVQACSTRGGLCSPEFSMTAAPGSITVHLNRNSCLFMDYADHSQHRIYFGKEGEKLQLFREAASSQFIRDLEVGQKYCAKVEFLLYDKPYGAASCLQCEVVPAPDDSKRTVTIVTVVIVLVILVLVPIISYVLIWRPKAIKKILKPQYHIPASLQPSDIKNVYVLSSSNQEDYDLISGMTPR